MDKLTLDGVELTVDNIIGKAVNGKVSVKLGKAAFDACKGYTPALTNVMHYDLNRKTIHIFDFKSENDENKVVKVYSKFQSPYTRFVMNEEDANKLYKGEKIDFDFADFETPSTPTTPVDEEVVA